MHRSTANAHRIAVMGGVRTPFVKAGTAFRRHRPLDLALHAVEGLLDRLNVDPAGIESLAYGIVLVDPEIPHVAREIVLESRLPESVRALTVTDNCISGISAMAVVGSAIAEGRAEVGIAGGVESMSNPAVQYGERARRALLDASRAKSATGKLKALLGARPWDFLPADPGFAEPSTGLSMGEHCEIMVKEWEIGRETQDLIAYRSHMNAHAATLGGQLTAEIVPLDGIDRDTLVRPDTSMERLAALPPVFDRSPSGTITAGNSSPLTDGASGILLMSEERAQREGREPLAFVLDFEFAGLSPSDGLLMAPALAVPRLLARTGLSLDRMDLVEMHEAFAGQIACNLKAWERGWKEPAIGTVPEEKLNRLGGSIALGHPFAATGARIATTLANELARRDARYGLVSICGAGATAAAMILERS
ncbi:MAG: acetyl-CoA C-acyltransferase [Gemmatimonadota bacterium]